MDGKFIVGLPKTDTIAVCPVASISSGAVAPFAVFAVAMKLLGLLQGGGVLVMV